MARTTDRNPGMLGVRGLPGGRPASRGPGGFSCSLPPADLAGARSPVIVLVAHALRTWVILALISPNR